MIVDRWCHDKAQKVWHVSICFVGFFFDTDYTQYAFRSNAFHAYPSGARNSLLHGANSWTKETANTPVRFLWASRRIGYIATTSHYLVWWRFRGWIARLGGYAGMVYPFCGKRMDCRFHRLQIDACPAFFSQEHDPYWLYGGTGCKCCCTILQS